MQLAGEARAVAARYVLVGGLAHPGHGRALRRVGDRVDQQGEKRFVEIVTGKCFDRLRDEGRRKLVELEPQDVDARADMDQRDLGALA